jgi:hypothetical protein
VISRISNIGEPALLDIAYKRFTRVKSKDEREFRVPHKIKPARDRQRIQTGMDRIDRIKTKIIAA